MTEKLQTREQMLAGMTNNTEQQAVPVAQERESALATAFCLLDALAGEGLSQTCEDGRTIEADDTVHALCSAFYMEPDVGWYRTLAAELAPLPCKSGEGAGRAIYVASRASIPERGAMWREYRAKGVPINSTWIDEDGPKASRDLAGLWDRIRIEVTSAERLVLYVEPDDFPLKGAFIEVGMALAANVPVMVVAPGVYIEPRNYRPLGSWMHSPLVSRFDTVEEAFGYRLAPRTDAAQTREAEAIELVREMADPDLQDVSISLHRTWQKQALRIAAQAQEAQFTWPEEAEFAAQTEAERLATLEDYYAFKRAALNARGGA